MKRKASKPKKRKRTLPKVGRRSPKELGQLAAGVVSGRMFEYDPDVSACGLVTIMLGGWVHDAVKRGHTKAELTTWGKDITIVCDARLATRAVNGVPFAMGYQLVHRDDWKEAVRMANALREGKV